MFHSVYWTGHHQAVVWFKQKRKFYFLYSIYSL